MIDNVGMRLRVRVRERKKLLKHTRGLELMVQECEPKYFMDGPLHYTHVLCHLQDASFDKQISDDALH